MPSDAALPDSVSVAPLPDIAASEYPQITPHLNVHNLQIRSTPERGRGVFTTAQLSRGTLLEISPVLILPSQQYSSCNLRQTIIEHYAFTWNKKGDQALALGLGSIFNHSRQPNVSYTLDKENQAVIYTLSKDVQPGQELFIYYGQVSFDASPPLSPNEQIDDWTAMSTLNLQEVEVETGPSAEVVVVTPIEAPKVSTFKRVSNKVALADRKLETVSAWISMIDPRNTAEVFGFLKRNKLSETPMTSHLKRARHTIATFDEPTQSFVLLCLQSEIDLEALKLLLSDPTIEHLNLVPIAYDVPTASAATREQLADWTRVWPVTFVPAREDRSSLAEDAVWTMDKQKWYQEKMDMLFELSLNAKSAGELPISCIVTESWDEGIHSSSNQPQQLASASDNRTSTNNPLSHAALRLVDHVSALDRANQRLSVADQTASSIPYLLTSLTVFISHEPCLFCSMALLHSRISALVYGIPSPGAGGCGSVFSVHEDKGLNHTFEVWQGQGSKFSKEVWKELDIDADP